MTDYFLRPLVQAELDSLLDRVKSTAMDPLMRTSEETELPWIVFACSPTICSKYHIGELPFWNLAMSEHSSRNLDMAYQFLER